MATRKKNEAGAVATYTVTSPLDHDQVRYEIGDEVDLTEAEAAPLLGLAVVVKNATAK